MVYEASTDRQLIESVEKKPQLYDKNDPRYKDQKAKNQLWEVIAADAGLIGLFFTLFLIFMGVEFIEIRRRFIEALETDTECLYKSNPSFYGKCRR